MWTVGSAAEPGAVKQAGAGMLVVLLVVVTLLGLVVGSFLNVVIHRVPRGESIVSPGSRCPSCGKPVRARHNIPVLGWLVLKGRCADCGEPIAVRYPLVELGTGLVFLAVAARMHHLDLLSALPAYLYFAAIGIALAVIDLDCRRLPSAIIMPSYVVLAALLTASSAAHDDWWALGRAAIGGAALFAFYFLLALVHPAGMGFGDVRLSGILGAVLAYLSWSTLVVGAFGGFVLGAVAGVAVLATGRGNRKTSVPFGPFMLLSALLAIFLAEPVAAWYRDLLV